MPEAKSPDGRIWKIESHRQSLALGDRAAKSFHLGNVIVTVIMLLIIVFFARRSTAIAIIAGILLLVWIFERGTSYFKPKIEATTEGPPRQHVGWVATNRFGHGELEKRAAEAIERGDPASEPPGLRLVEL